MFTAKATVTLSCCKLQQGLSQLENWALTLQCRLIDCAPIGNVKCQLVRCFWVTNQSLVRFRHSCHVDAQTMLKIPWKVFLLDYIHWSVMLIGRIGESFSSVCGRVWYVQFWSILVLSRIQPAAVVMERVKFRLLVLCCGKVNQLYLTRALWN